MVVTAAALIRVPPPASVVRLESAAVPPITPPKVVVPAVSTARFEPPLTVHARVMAALPVEFSVVLGPCKATASP